MCSLPPGTELEFCWGAEGGLVSFPSLSGSARWLCQSVLARKAQVEVGGGLPFQLNGPSPQGGLSHPHSPCWPGHWLRKEGVGEDSAAGPGCHMSSDLLAGDKALCVYVTTQGLSPSAGQSSGPRAVEQGAIRGQR